MKRERNTLRQTSPALQPFFSFEKELWAKNRGTKLELCRLERFLDKPVLKPGPAGSPDEHRIEWTNVVRQNGRFAMFYAAMRPPPQNVWHMRDIQSICIAYSDDGIEWEKPALNLSGRAWGAAPDNVLPGVSGDTYGCGVMHDGNRFVMMHIHPRGLKAEVPQTTFSIFTSGDGVRWRGNRRPCIDVQHFEPGPTLFKFKDRYWVLGQGISPYYHMPDGRPCGRVLFAYQSKDLKSWTRGQSPAYAYPIPNHFPEAAVQNHGGAAAIDRGRIAIGFMGQFWPAGFSESVRSTFGLIYSYDGARWTEPFQAEPLLMPRDGAWDCGMLLQGSGLYSRGQTSLYWYTGLDGGNLWWPHGSAGVCRIRRDGFAHLSPSGQTPATVETVAIPVSAKDQFVYLNAECSSKAPIEVTCLDERGRRIGGGIMRESAVLAPIAKLDPAHRTRKMIVRFRISPRARIYSFYVGQSIELAEYLDRWIEG